MLTELKISLDSLNDGKTVSFDEELSSDILDLQEEGVGFDKIITVQGTAYIASDQLIIHFDASITAFLPCKICNQMTPVALEVKKAYYIEDISALGSVVNIAQAIREALLLKLPEQVECNDNHCPHRDEIAKYLTGEKKKDGDPESPFSKFLSKS